MKNLIFFYIALTLTGCMLKAPPKFPKGKEMNPNTFNFNKINKGVVLSSKNNKQFCRKVKGLKFDSQSQFWFLAHHAKKIQLTGKKKNIYRKMLELRENGVEAIITFVEKDQKNVNFQFDFACSNKKGRK